MCSFVISCIYWQPSKIFFRGICIDGKYKGKPSFGACVDLCKKCQTSRKELEEYMTLLVAEGTIKRNGQKIEKKPCPNCGKIKNIVKGFGSLVWQRIAKVKPEDWVVERAEICSQCEYRTFLNIIKWGLNFLPDDDLPINHEPRDWDAAWCSKCKCCIEAKIRVQDEKCPLNKWSEQKVE